jgi:hypothetical protein
VCSIIARQLQAQAALDLCIAVRKLHQDSGQAVCAEG